MLGAGKGGGSDAAQARAPGANAGPGAGVQSGQFLAGDGVRGIGMVCVLFAHVAPGALVLVGIGVYDQGLRHSFGTVLGVLMSGLQLAVPMFFVMSGYLISRPWVRAYVLARKAPRLWAYALNRTLRIVPVFWLLTTVTLVALGSHGASAGDLVAIYGFGQIYHGHGTEAQLLGQAWTIDVEVAFYILVPPCAYLVMRAARRVGLEAAGRGLDQRQRIAVVVVLVTAATVASAWLRGATIGSLWNFSPPATFYYFGPGVALAALEIGLTGRVARRRLRYVPIIFGVCAGAIAVVLAVDLSTDANSVITARGSFAVALGSALALGALLARQLVRGDSPRWVDNRVTRWLGQRSYPCYVVQTLTIGWAVLALGKMSGPWVAFVAFTAFSIPLTLVLGAIVHVMFERPLLDWGHRRTRRPSRPVPARSVKVLASD